MPKPPDTPGPLETPEPADTPEPGRRGARRIPGALLMLLGCLPGLVAVLVLALGAGGVERPAAADLDRLDRPGP
ncbi:hypothetical protein ABT288_45190, partial [Streptomyces sp. NPDC001093]